VKGIWVTVKGFQKFKGRGDVVHNSWFRCSNRITEDADFFDFSHAEFKAWIYILCLTSQKNSDTVYVNFDHAERVCGLKRRDVQSAVLKLRGNQLLPADDTSTVRARDADDTSTCATDRQTDRDNKQREVVESSDSTLPHLAVLWNNHIGGKLAKVSKSNAGRNKKADLRFKDHSDLEWVGIIERIAASDFCCGVNDRGWKATFDWLLQSETALKVLEGKYDNRGPKALSSVDLSEINFEAGA
jgi:hypothetical protein